MNKPAEPAPEAPASSSAPVQGVTVAELVAPLPEVNEAAIEAEKQDQEQEAAELAQGKPEQPGKKASPPPPSSGLPPTKPDLASKPAPTDSKGRTFDPRIHEQTADGRPIFCKESPYLKQRRHPLPSWKSASVVQEPAAPVEGAVSAAPTAPDASKEEQLAAAQTFAGVQLLIMRRAFGESIAKRQDEAGQLVDAWTKVLNHYGMGAMHPILGLTLVSTGLVMANVNEPDTRSSLAKLRDWFERLGLGLWQRIRRRFGWREAKQEEEPKPKAAEEKAPAEAVETNGHGRRL